MNPLSLLWPIGRQRPQTSAAHVSFLRRKGLSKTAMARLIKLSDALSEQGHHGYPTPEEIGAVHHIIETWSGYSGVADAMLQTVGVSVSTIQSADGRDRTMSNAHPMAYEDQSKFGPRSSPEAALAGLRYLVRALIERTQHTGPTELLCAIVNERWDRETEMRQALASIRDRMLEQPGPGNYQERLSVALQEDFAKAFSKLTWGR